MLKKSTMIAALFACTAASAENVPITGNVESKCTIYTTKTGVFGSPTSSVLTTDPFGGGVNPMIRINAATGGNYIAKITTPSGFTSSPSLNEQQQWLGRVDVKQVSDPLMSDYDTNKVVYDNTHEYDLTVAGSTWFEIESTMTYGFDKPLPGGSYVAMVVAECIAK